MHYLNTSLKFDLLYNAFQFQNLKITLLLFLKMFDLMLKKHFLLIAVLTYYPHQQYFHDEELIQQKHEQSQSDQNLYDHKTVYPL